MPPNTSRKVTNLKNKNNDFIQAYLDDVKVGDVPVDVHIARVLKKLGDGRVEVFYIGANKKPSLSQAVIRGSFRGKGKHAVWIDPGSIVLAADSGIPGSASMEIMAVLDQESLDKIRKSIDIDSRILAIDNTDGARLVDGSADDDGVIFEDDKKEDEDLNIDAI
jgi:hypothetical protein